MKNTCHQEINQNIYCQVRNMVFPFIALQPARR